MTGNRKYEIGLAGFVFTFLGAVLFSTKAIIVKKAFADIKIDAVSLLALRMLFSLPFYIVAALLARRQEKTRLTRKQWWYIILLGLFGYYLSSLFDFLGLKYISAGLERLILFLYPTFTLFINAIVFKEKIKKIQAIALLLTYMGIAIAYVGELSIDTENPGLYWGSFLIFLCAVTYAIYIVGSGRMVPQVGVTRFTALAMLTSTLGVFAHFLIKGNYEWANSTSSFWWYGLILGIIATVIPTFLISAGMKRIGANNVAIVSSIGPVSTIIQAHFILGEKIFTAQIMGTVLVVMGVVLIGWKGGAEKE
jgi:drug/metabolite transporter (DMT)-like permease